MPETPYTREYYLEKAEGVPLLEMIISGETSFAGRIDELFAEIEKDREENKDTWGLGLTYTVDRAPLENLSSCIETIVALAGLNEGDMRRSLDAAYCYWDRTAGRGGKRNIRWWNATIYSMSTAAVTALALTLPGGALIEAAVVLLGGAGTAYGIRKVREGNEEAHEEKERCEKTLAPVYEAAWQLDSEIGRLFASDQFHDCRENFERTYRMLDEEGRGAVALELREQLTMGCVDMGEAELDSYLGSLTKEGVAPDA